MKSATLAMYLAFVAGCGNKPSKADVDAFRSAQRIALERLQTVQKAFDAALAEVEDGKWTPRPDLGACTASLPSLPSESETDDASMFPAFFLAKNDPLGWSGISQRVFDKPRLAIGNPDGWLPNADTIAAETKRIAELVPFETDVLVLRLDEDVRPKGLGGDRFEPGSDRGRAWAWSATTHEIICAGEFAAVTPPSVTAKIFDRRAPGTDVDVSLLLAQRRASTRSAVEHLVAAGPPTSE